MFLLAFTLFAGSSVLLALVVSDALAGRGNAFIAPPAVVEAAESVVDASVSAAPIEEAVAEAVVAEPGDSSATIAPLSGDRLAVVGGDPRLHSAILDAVAGAGGSTSVVVLRLGDGLAAEVDGDGQYYAASLFKLAILYEAERRISLGEFSLDSPVLYTAEAFAEDLGTVGSLSFSDDGTIPLGDALAAMVEISDNSSAIAIVRMLGPGTVDETMRSLGLEVTSVNTTELPTTARDMARLMQAIVNGEGVTETQRQHMRQLLLGQHTRDGIPAGLPEGIVSGNKTGTWDGATHDVAFVDAPGGEYVIAVLTDRGWDWPTIANVSAAVYGVLLDE
ncbi:hypothetical protein AYO38_07920 [bacterium SCGC AG-212-C10]|nr:hypothetical protein AYO38_07905 [bacterium SCGC AG-212-C10]OAI39338.1 hypothetical protein AYO38_07920 [bacterium SCGC AG-212-C10]